MNMRCFRLKLHRSLILSALVLAAIILSGCFNKTPAVTEPVLEPQEVLTKVLSGYIYTPSPSQTISPRGDYLLAEKTDEAGFHIVAVSLKEDEGEDVVLYTVSRDDSGAFTRLVPVGWASPETCVFLAAGEQDEGPNKGKRGVAIMLGNVTVPRAEELAFVELETGLYRSVTFVEDEAKVFVHVSGALWEYDLRNESLRLVKGGLPSYDGLFTVRISPTGRYAVYELHEQDKEGIYILDIATGEERALLPTGTTKSFLPQWSPDGKYILAYTAGQKPNAAELEPWERYEVFHGEDSLLPIAASLTVVTPEGEVRKTVAVEGKTLAHARWARNSETIGFLAGVPRDTGDGSGGQGFPQDPLLSAVAYDSAMLVDVSNDAGAVRVADLTALPGFEDPSIELALVDPSGKGLYFVASKMVDSSLQGSKLWYASREGEPASVCDGRWQFAGMEPVYGDHVAGVLFLEDRQSVWLVGPEDSRMLASFDKPQSRTRFVGYNEDLLVVGTWDYSGSTDTTTVTVYRMYAEAQP